MNLSAVWRKYNAWIAFMIVSIGMLGLGWMMATIVLTVENSAARADIDAAYRKLIESKDSQITQLLKTNTAAVVSNTTAVKANATAVTTAAAVTKAAAQTIVNSNNDTPAPIKPAPKGKVNVR